MKKKVEFDYWSDAKAAAVRSQPNTASRGSSVGPVTGLITVS